MIKVENLHKHFGDNEVLKGMNNTIKEKEVVCIIGPSGSGKSTFLRCLNLLEDVTEGKITIDNQEITARGTNVPKIRSMPRLIKRFNSLEERGTLRMCTTGRPSRSSM